MNSHKTVDAVCPACGEKITLDIEAKGPVECPHCHHRYEINDLLRDSHAYREPEKPKKIRIGGLIFGTIIALLLCLFAHLDNAPVSAAIALVSAILFVICILLKKKVIKAPSAVRIILTLAAVFCIIPYVYCFKRYSSYRLQKYDWDDVILKEELPEPSSHYGRLSSNSSDSLTLYVYHTSSDDYDSYVDACQEKGYTVDEELLSYTFRAASEDGYDLNLRYNDSEECMEIMLEKQAAETATPTATATSTPTATPAATATADTSTASDQVTPSFKEAMDSYEAFFDEYVEFLQSYDSSDLEMAAEYADMMSQYADTCAKIDAIDESTLSPADDAYYIEVTGRITQKLMTVGQSLS